jgi:hypothetical protein
MHEVASVVEHTHICDCRSSQDLLQPFSTRRGETKTWQKLVPSPEGIRGQPFVFLASGNYDFKHLPYYTLPSSSQVVLQKHEVPASKSKMRAACTSSAQFHCQGLHSTAKVARTQNPEDEIANLLRSASATHCMATRHLGLLHPPGII